VVSPFDQRLQASPDYHTFFFENAGLSDKLSIVARCGDWLLLCNPYRMADSGSFEEPHVTSMGSPGTCACIRTCQVPNETIVSAAKLLQCAKKYLFRPVFGA